MMVRTMIYVLFLLAGVCNSSGTVKVGNKVVVIGGGFGGLYSAIKTAEKYPALDVTLIDTKDKFVFLPLLYELVTGAATAEEVAPSFESLLKDSPVTFVQGRVNDVNMNTKTISYEEINSSSSQIASSSSTIATTLNYDQLVIAAGAQARLEVPGAKEFALPFYTVEDAYNLQLQLRSAISNAESDGREMVRVVVVGGGYSGVETATSIANYLGKSRAVVSLVDRNSRIMTTSPESNRQASEKALLSFGVSINSNTDVKEVLPDGVLLETKDEDFNTRNFVMPADLVIYTAGMKQTDLVTSCLCKDLDTNEYGRIRTSRTLQTLKYPEVFAIGDCASVENSFIPSTAQVAMQQSEILSSNVGLRYEFVSRNEDNEPLSRYLEKFTYVPLGEMLTLGGANAAISSLNDNVKIAGPAASAARRLVYSYRMPTSSQQFKAFTGAIQSTLTPFLSSGRRK